MTPEINELDAGSAATPRAFRPVGVEPLRLFELARRRACQPSQTPHKEPHRRALPRISLLAPYKPAAEADCLAAPWPFDGQ